MRRFLTLLVFLTALMTPALARAGTASVAVNDPCGGCEEFEFPLTYAAAPGEQNTVTVTRPSAGTYIVEDATAPVTAGSSCTSLDTHRAACSEATSVTVYAGDQDDQVTFESGVRGLADGGTGDDVLTGDGSLEGGPGADQLTGGPEADALAGGAGRDRLSGGAGDDMLAGDDAGAPDEPDVIDGGPGTESIALSGDGASVDLAAGRAGADTVTSVEDVAGTKGADELRGDEGPNVLYGDSFNTAGYASPRVHDIFDGRGGDDTIYATRGDDQIDAGGGDDLVKGFGGNDVISGGSGDDVIHGGFGSSGAGKFAGRSRIACGSGTDSVAFVRAVDFVARDCESVGIYRFRISPVHRLKSGRGLSLRFRSASFFANSRDLCGGTLWAMSGHTTVASRDFSLRPTTARTVTLPFSRLGRTVLAHYRHPLIRLLIRPSSHCHPRVDHHSRSRDGYVTSP